MDGRTDIGMLSGYHDWKLETNQFKPGDVSMYFILYFTARDLPSEIAGNNYLVSQKLSRIAFVFEIVQIISYFNITLF